MNMCVLNSMMSAHLLVFEVRYDETRGTRALLTGWWLGCSIKWRTMDLHRLYPNYCQFQWENEEHDNKVN